MLSPTLLHYSKTLEDVQVESTLINAISFIFLSGRAVNYKMDVPSFQECHNVCVSDQRCCHFSYNISKDESYPDQAHCFLYSAENCDMASLVLRDHPSPWRTGRIARCQPQFHFKRKQLFGSEFVGWQWFVWESKSNVAVEVWSRIMKNLFVRLI